MQNLTLHKVNIRDADGNPVPIDYILGKVPEVTYFSYDNECEIYSNQSLSKLNSINFKNKLCLFSLNICRTSEGIDAEILGEFIEFNLASNALVILMLPRNAPGIGTLKLKLQQIVNNWQSPDGNLSLDVSLNYVTIKKQ